MGDQSYIDAPAISAKMSGTEFGLKEFEGEKMFRVISALALTAFLVAGGTATNNKAEPAAKVTVTEVRAPDLASALKEQKGKVVLIDCWATWCAPCVKKFPHLVELHKKYNEKGLICVSLSLDKLGPDDSYKRENVLKFLKEKEATFPNFIVAEPKKDEEALIKLLGDYSAIPYMVMFDRTGRRAWVSDEKKITNEQLDKLIEEQLAEKP
jgi:thiol-disulfide isomerase/thioredoxin